MSTYREIRNLKRDTTTTRVAIREVNAADNYIRAEDPYGGVVQITLSLQSPVVALPVVGETWTAVRTGNDWTLDKRLETGSEQTAFGALLEGDRRLEAPNTLHLNGETIMLNGEDLVALLTQIKTILGIL